MVRIAPVALQYNPRVLWFDPRDLEIRDGDPVIVRTDRGLEFGHAKDIIEVDEQRVKSLRSPLKPVERLATDEDIAQVEELRERGREALPVFKRLAAETNEDMHPVLVEFLFDSDRAVFFFEAEERIDFRDLVRKLANEFHVRVDMRQIGVRDEARIVGGIGHCGQELCCHRLGGEFCPVSIRMAKEQDISLNPQKISGLCGRLMCCLRYEYDAYKDFKSRAPKQNARIQTPDGTAKVTALNVPKELVTVRVEDGGAQVTFPLSAMDEVPEGSESKRPTSIGEAFEEYANPDPFANATSMFAFNTSGFTGTDKLAKPEARHNPRRESAAKKGEGAQATEHRKPRRRRRGKGNGDGQLQDAAAAQAPKNAAAAPGSEGSEDAKQGSSRRRRRRRGGGGGQQQATGGAQQPAQRQGARPGQKSSSLSQAARQGAGEAQPSADAHRKRRRRSHTTGEKGGGSDES